MGFIKWLLVIACFGLNGQTALAEAQAAAPSASSSQLEDNITELRKGLISVMAQNKIPVTHNAAVIKFNNVGEKVGELMIGSTGLSLSVGKHPQKIKPTRVKKQSKQVNFSMSFSPLLKCKGKSNRWALRIIIVAKRNATQFFGKGDIALS